ncbi:MAG TPA: hypothetical protein VMZ26_17195 [Pyrinomonadaceae bacterium]|nr:hypothetical protein [Pyrinomonadaceae bacterium]
MRKQIIFTFAAAVMICAAVPAFAQGGLTGTWEWRSPMDKQKRQTYFSITINPKNGKVAGTYFFNELENGDTESDGAVAAFIGTVVGNTIKIEFDPNAADPGYTEHVRYKKPKGRLPSTATLTLKNGKLQWVQTRGILDKEMPRTFTLVRSR